MHRPLAVGYADLGRREEAVREARQAVALLPVGKDAGAGPAEVRNLAEIHVKVGEPEAAIDRLETLVRLPNGIAVAELRTDPF